MCDRRSCVTRSRSSEDGSLGTGECSREFSPTGLASLRIAFLLRLATTRYPVLVLLLLASRSIRDATNGFAGTLSWLLLGWLIALIARNVCGTSRMLVNSSQLVANTHTCLLS